MTADVECHKKEMYEDLIRQYDLTSERRKTLTGQASNLLGFAGVIETILIAAVVALATDSDARSLIQSSLWEGYPIIILAGIGFLSYIVTTIYSLRAYYEPEWVPAPQFPVTAGNLEDSVEIYWDNASVYSRKDAAKHLAQGIEFDQGVNNDKFINLKRASFALMIGIISSIVAGIMFLITAL